MGFYRVIINGQDTGEYIVASSPQDAYADVSASIALKYSDEVRLSEIGAPLDRPGLVGNNIIHELTESLEEQHQTTSQDVRAFKESLSGTAPAGTDRERKFEESLFEKVEDAYELDTSTFD